MTLEHLSQTQLTRYSGRTLEPHELLAADRHLASCDECHERLARIAPGDAQFAIRRALESGQATGEGVFHLDYEHHLEPYVDGKANDIDRELVESHVAVCSSCATDLEDLLEFKQQPVAAISADADTSLSWKRWLPQLSLPSSHAWAAAVVVVAAFALAGAVVFWTRYPLSGSVPLAESVLPESDRQRPAAETAQPSPAPTERIADKHAGSPQPKGADSGSPEQPLLILNDAAGQLIVTQSGRLEGLDQLPSDLQENVERALVTRQLDASPGLTGWATYTDRLRNEFERQNTFCPSSPTNVVLETNQPTFRWLPLEGAQHYIVTIYDDKLRKVSSSDPVSGTEWTIPNTLARGVTYSWQVSAVKDGETVVSPKPPQPQARFRVLDRRALATLAKLKESAKRSHLALGVFYWKHGLIDESEREFQALAAANPNSPAAAELLASIRSIRRR